MLNLLNHAITLLPDYLKRPELWQSLIIDRRKPITHRAFTMIGDNRLCLHKFEQFDQTSEEGFFHPHPWPGAFKIIDGAYRMETGHTRTRTDKDLIRGLTIELAAGSAYEIVSPLDWHRVIPMTPVVYTIMLNGEPWGPDVAHTSVRTTKGKDLKQMTPEQLQAHLDFFAGKIKV